MPRRLFTLAAAVSLLLCLATAGLWLRSSRKHDTSARALAALEGAEAYEALSLDPVLANPPPENFHGYRILGRASISNPAIRKKLNDALRAGMYRSNRVMACFDPRHALHVTTSGTTTDIVICFHCQQAQMFVEGKQTGWFLTTASPESEFDRVLTDAGVPLASKAR